MKDPHLVDPIYFHYKSGLENTKQSIDKLKVEIESTNSHLDKTEADPGDRRQYLEILYEQQHKLEKLQQEKLYLSQKLSDRIKSDAVEYKKAFDAKKTWPDPAEFKSFQLENTLKEGQDKEWDSEKRIKELTPKKETPKAATGQEASEHH